MAISIEKLQETFQTMSYGDNVQDTTQANEWLQTLEIVDRSSELENILKNIKPGKYTQTRHSLIRLAEELEGHIGIIMQIEALSRGVLAKDTKQGVQNLAQYFYYYASFVREEPNQTSNDVAVGIFEDDHPLWLLGVFLGPALAAGRSIILQIGTKLAAVATFIVNAAIKIGVPKEALMLVPSNDGDLQPYLSHKDVAVVALFVDIFNEKFRGVNRYHKKLLIFAGHKTPMLVFDNCDLDSAVECAIDASWSYQGMLPWSIDCVLIQENVFQKFVDKIKIRLESLTIGSGDDKLADIAFPSNPGASQKLMQAVEKAKSMGIEIFQKQTEASSQFTPTLVIGSKIGTNNVVTSTENNYCLPLLPFRTVDEAVNLANNTRQGLGASVWSENIGLVNEVARKLQVSNIWINCHGLFAADIPLTPMKDSGVGYFGGKQGFLEYTVTKLNATSTPEDVPNSYKEVEEVKSAVKAGKTARAAWIRTSTLERIKNFGSVLDLLEANEKKLSKNLPESWLKNFSMGLRHLLTEAPNFEKYSTQSGFSVSSLKYPRGTMVIETRSPIECHPAWLILAALYEGNAVILLNDSPETKDFYKELSKKFPAGLLSVIPYSLDAVRSASRHKEVSAYVSDVNAVFGLLPLRESKMFNRATNELNNWDLILNLVTVVKNVWSNVGQSCQCNL